MKKTTLLLTTLFFMAFSAFASSPINWECTANLPEGTAELTLEKGLNEGEWISFAFHNTDRNQIYAGKLEITEVSIIPNQRTDFVAEGTLGDGEEIPFIDVAIYGQLIESENGRIHLQLYAGGNHRIEFGFGNPLQCVE